MVTRGLKRALVGMAVMLIGFSPLLAHTEESAPTQVSAPDNYDLIYPKAADLFVPRLIGNPDALNKVTLMLAPGFLGDHLLFRNLYSQLLPLINIGKAKLEIQLFGHNQMGLPAYLIAQCVDPAAMGDFLYTLFSSWDKIIQSNAEISKSLKLVALSNPEFMPIGLTKDQFKRRLDWCLMNRREGLIASETQRFTIIYNGNFKHGGAVLAPVIVVNDKKVFEGSVTIDSLLEAMK